MGHQIHQQLHGLRAQQRVGPRRRRQVVHPRRAQQVHPRPCRPRRRPVSPPATGSPETSLATPSRGLVAGRPGLPAVRLRRRLRSGPGSRFSSPGVPATRRRRVRYPGRRQAPRRRRRPARAAQAWPFRRWGPGPRPSPRRGPGRRGPRRRRASSSRLVTADGCGGGEGASTGGAGCGARCAPRRGCAAGRRSGSGRSPRGGRRRRGGRRAGPRLSVPSPRLVVPSAATWTVFPSAHSPSSTPWMSRRWPWVSRDATRARWCTAVASAISSTGGSGSSRGSASCSAATVSTSCSYASRVRCRVVASSRSRASPRPAVTVSRGVSPTCTASVPSRVARVPAGMTTLLRASGSSSAVGGEGGDEEAAGGRLGARPGQAEPGRWPDLQQRMVQGRRDRYQPYPGGRLLRRPSPSRVAVRRAFGSAVVRYPSGPASAVASARSRSAPMSRSAKKSRSTSGSMSGSTSGSRSGRRPGRPSSRRSWSGSGEQVQAGVARPGARGAAGDAGR